jgi:hypothetical protein
LPIAEERWSKPSCWLTKCIANSLKRNAHEKTEMTVSNWRTQVCQHWVLDVVYGRDVIVESPGGRKGIGCAPRKWGKFGAFSAYLEGRTIWLDDLSKMTGASEFLIGWEICATNKRMNEEIWIGRRHCMGQKIMGSAKWRPILSIFKNLKPARY